MIGLDSIGVWVGLGEGRGTLWEIERGKKEKDIGNHVIACGMMRLYGDWKLG